jgi:hypothetical protein
MASSFHRYFCGRSWNVPSSELKPGASFVLCAFKTLKLISYFHISLPRNRCEHTRKNPCYGHDRTTWIPFCPSLSLRHRCVPVRGKPPPMTVRGTVVTACAEELRVTGGGCPFKRLIPTVTSRVTRTACWILSQWLVAAVVHGFLAARPP